ncbi:MAG: pirin family protein [Polyangiaceae bacterium]
MHGLRRRDFLRASAGFAAVLAGCGERAAAPEARAPSPSVRAVTRVVPGAATIEGAGVHLSRTLGGRALPDLDPFLLLDEIRSDKRSDYERGFPDHPHRGFETVTYMIEGAMEHRDSVGNHGLLVDGSAQWMTAGHGIIHSEMPRQDSGWLHGLQLWVNLPAANKLDRPRYQDIAPRDIPEVSMEGARTRVVAGVASGVEGAVRGIVQAPTMLDVTLAAGQTVEVPLPSTDNAFAYVLDGAAEIGPEATAVPKAALAVLGAGDGARLRGGSSGARLLLLSAKPTREPIARRGPFVMNTRAELQQAFEDYRSGALTLL